MNIVGNLGVGVGSGNFSQAGIGNEIKIFFSGYNHYMSSAADILGKNFKNSVRAAVPYEYTSSFPGVSYDILSFSSPFVQTTTTKTFSNIFGSSPVRILLEDALQDGVKIGKYVRTKNNELFFKIFTDNDNNEISANGTVTFSVKKISKTGIEKIISESIIPIDVPLTRKASMAYTKKVSAVVDFFGDGVDVEFGDRIFLEYISSVNATLKTDYLNANQSIKASLSGFENIRISVE